MKTNVPVDEVVVYGQDRALAAKSFSYKNSAKQVEILVSRIYEDKVSAIIREICSNAYDAHVLVGKSHIPFRVQLPSALDQRFVVRDFGPGMTPGQVENVYTQFFNSTKEESNDFLGALGLGAKSPFSLVDSYTVTSYQSGTMMCYTLFKRDGELFHRPETPNPVPTDEPDGLEVSIPVDPKLEREFQKKSEKILYWFDVRPDLPTCVPAWEGFDKHCLLTLDGPHGSIRAFKSGYGSLLVGGYSRDRISIRMGQVLYPINSNEVSIPELPYNTVFVIDIPIGAADVQAGREALSYDENTVLFLNECLQTAIKLFVAEVVKPINDAPNIRAASACYSNIQNRYGFTPKTKFKGFRISGVGPWPTTQFNARSERIASLYIAAKDEGKGYGYDEEEGLYEVDTPSLSKQVLAYVLIDEDTGVSRKLTNLRKLLRKDFAESEAKVELIIIDGRPASVFEYDSPVKDAKPLTSEEVAQIRAVLDPNDRVYQLSKIESTSEITTAFTFTPNKRSNFVNRREWRPATLTDEGGLFWPIVNGTMQYCSGKNNTRAYGSDTDLDYALSSILDYVRGKFPKQQVLLVPEQEVEKLSDKWINIPEFMVSELKRHLKDGEWRRGFVRSVDPASIDFNRHYARYTEKLLKYLPDDHPVCYLHTLCEYDRAHADEFTLFQYVLWLGDDKRFSPPNIRARGGNRYYIASEGIGFANRILKNFPLLFTSHDAGHIDDLVLYANTKFEILKSGDETWRVKRKRTPKLKSKIKAKKAEMKDSKGKPLKRLGRFRH